MDELDPPEARVRVGNRARPKTPIGPRPADDGPLGRDRALAGSPGGQEADCPGTLLCVRPLPIGRIASCLSRQPSTAILPMDLRLIGPVARVAEAMGLIPVRDSCHDCHRLILFSRYSGTVKFDVGLTERMADRAVLMEFRRVLVGFTPLVLRLPGGSGGSSWLLERPFRSAQI